MKVGKEPLHVVDEGFAERERPRKITAESNEVKSVFEASRRESRTSKYSRNTNEYYS
jgi:hypothetical protein